MIVIPAAINIRIMVLPVISFMATIVPWIVTFPFITIEENRSDSNEPFPVALAIAIFCALVCAADGLDATISSDKTESDIADGHSTSWNISRFLLQVQ